MYEINGLLSSKSQNIPLSLTFFGLLLAYRSQNPSPPPLSLLPSPPPQFSMHCIVLASFASGPGKGLNLQKRWPFTPSLDGSLACPSWREGGCTTKGKERRPPLQAWLQPLLELFVSPLEPERSVPKDVLTARESVGS